MCIALDYGKLRGVTLAYCALPICLFCLFWLQPLIGIAVAGTFVAAFILMHHNNCQRVPSPLSLVRIIDKSGEKNGRPFPIDSDSIVLSVHALLLIVLTSLLWCIFGGQGGMWYQSGDWNSRNALFRDLITHKWPVCYAVDNGWLSYYIAHWLPAALVGKMASLIGLGQEVAWTAGNIALLIWTSTGTALVLFHIVVATRARGMAQTIVCVMLSVFFATPDLVGRILTGGYPRDFENMHIEWWAINMQFSSLTTCLFWVFNQAVIPWLCTLCFINERSFGGYLPIWACCLFAGPFPALGLAQMMLGYGVYILFKSQSKGKTIRAVFSPPNVLAMPAIAVLILYFITNGASAADANAAWTKETLLLPPLYFPSQPKTVAKALVFVLVEVLLIPLLLRACNMRGPLLPIATIVLLLCPWIRTSELADYCMRVSIPAIMSLCVLCALVLVRALAVPAKGHAVVPVIVLTLALVVGAATPVFEFSRGFVSVAQHGIAGSINDPFESFENKQLFDLENGWPRTNYVTQPSQENSLFFKYLAQR